MNTKLAIRRKLLEITKFYDAFLGLVKYPYCFRIKPTNPPRNCSLILPKTKCLNWVSMVKMTFKSCYFQVIKPSQTWKLSSNMEVSHIYPSQMWQRSLRILGKHCIRSSQIMGNSPNGRLWFFMKTLNEIKLCYRKKDKLQTKQIWNN